jgi:hypothetical protein
MPLNEFIAFVQPYHRKTEIPHSNSDSSLFLECFKFKFVEDTRKRSEDLEISIYTLLCGGFLLSIFADTIPMLINRL